jgi:hypothetical protein
VRASVYAEESKLAKKKVTSSTAGTESSSDNVDLDQVEERLRMAREELRSAREEYAEAMKKADATERGWHEGSFGEFLDSSLEFVKKYPAVGLAAATMVGVFFGRVFKR